MSVRPRDTVRSTPLRTLRFGGMWRRRPVPRATLTIVVGLLAAAIAIALGATGPLRQLERDTVDQRFVVRGNQPDPKDVVVVGINEQTLRALPYNWPFPRSLHARVIENLLRDGARVVAYDIEFSAASTPLEDAALLSEARRAGPRLVLGTTLIKNGRDDVIDGARLRASGVHIANSDFRLDDDGVIRRVPGRVHGQPQFAVTAARLASPKPIHQRPLRGSGAWIDYTAPDGDLHELSYVDVLRGQVDPKFVRGKVVIVGATATVLQDHHTTPLGEMTGPQVLAAATHTVLDGFPLSDPPGWLEPLTAILAGLVAPLATLRGRAGREIVRALVAAAVGLVVLLVGTQVAFNAGAVIGLVVPLLALVLGTVGAVALAYATEVRARRRTRTTFERFVPKEVVGELLERTDASPRLPGERIEATVLFCDLRGFTSLAEQLEGDVIDVLNRWFNEMGDAVLDHGGTLVSFQGDGIMSVFGAPLHVPDHAAQALAAAREMLDVRLPRFNAWLEDHGLIDEPKRMGIGINTGTIMSGSVGSERRLEYAAVGDATNTASRLQSLSKQSDHQLFVAQSTRDALGDADGLVRLGPMELPGRREPCTVWTLG
jgi:adenylate cyclase